MRRGEATPPGAAAGSGRAGKADRRRETSHQSQQLREEGGPRKHRHGGQKPGTGELGTATGKCPQDAGHQRPHRHCSGALAPGKAYEGFLIPEAYDVIPSLKQRIQTHTYLNYVKTICMEKHTAGYVLFQ